MHPVEKVFGNSIHVKMMLLFYNNDGYLNNITGLAKMLDVSQVTVRKVVSDLLDAGIVSELTIGMSRVVKINEHSPYTEALFNFIDTIRSISENMSIEEIIEMRTGQAKLISRIERFNT